MLNINIFDNKYNSLMQIFVLNVVFFRKSAGFIKIFDIFEKCQS
jgi:hypothetical protein